MGNNNRNHHNLITLYIAIASLITAAIALGVAVKSCSVSDKASGEVRNYFLEVSKPLVTIIPVHHQKDNHYLRSSFEKDTFRNNLRFEVKNTGRAAARDIAVTEIEIIPRRVSAKKTSLSYERPPKLSLGPGEFFYFSPEIRFRVDPEAAKKTRNSLNRYGWETFARIAVSYSHEKDLSVGYKTVVEYDISRDKAVPRRSVASKK